jgi:hypothetical protein
MVGVCDVVIVDRTKMDVVVGERGEYVFITTQMSTIQFAILILF